MLTNNLSRKRNFSAISIHQVPDKQRKKYHESDKYDNVQLPAMFSSPPQTSANQNEIQMIERPNSEYDADENEILYFE